MRALKELFMVFLYLGIVYLLINFTIIGGICYVIGALIVWAENIKYDDMKISPIRVKFPLLTAIFFLPILLIISFVNFFIKLSIND